MPHAREGEQMTLREVHGLPVFYDPIGAEEAAALYDRVFGTSTTVETFRVWLAENDDRIQCVTRKKVGKSWMVDRASMLDVIEAWADRMLMVVEQERESIRRNEGER
jgi:hypothetical protein